MQKKTFLVVIPARGGSKRLPRKNILDFNGKPMIAWTIEAALQSKYINDIVVTTDDKEISQVATSLEAKIVNRPDNLASDTATSFDVVKHVVENVDKKYDFIVLLQPTSPLRNCIHIDEAIELLINKNADAVISVVKMEHSPLWANTLPKDKSMKGFIKKELQNTRSQDIEDYYQLNGAIYICKTDILLKEKTFLFADNIFAYEMDRRSSIDIDDEVDFKIAELFANKKI